MLKRKVFVKCEPSTQNLGRIWASSASHSYGLTCLHYVQGFYFWGVGIGCRLLLCQCSYIILQPCAFNVKACIGTRLWLVQQCTNISQFHAKRHFIIMMYSVKKMHSFCVLLKTRFKTVIKLFVFEDYLKWALDDSKANNYQTIYNQYSYKNK